MGFFVENLEIFEKSCNFSQWNASINTGTPSYGTFLWGSFWKEALGKK
jgi:hypothetical protein